MRCQGVEAEATNLALKLALVSRIVAVPTIKLSVRLSQVQCNQI